METKYLKDQCDIGIKYLDYLKNELKKINDDQFEYFGQNTNLKQVFFILLWQITKIKVKLVNYNIWALKFSQIRKEEKLCT